MMRLSGATDQNNSSVVSGVQYNAASQLTNITYYNEVETRAYNSLMQLTNITTSLSGTQQLNVTYNYPGGSNNGKISTTSDAISGETVTYQYDSLNRLISASGSGWTQTQAYDGFGNLTGRTGTGSAQGTTISTPVDAATNQLSGYSYDNNGNLISTGYTYDAENRIQFAVAGNDQYFYDGQNKRIWQANCTSGNCLSGFVLASEIVNMYGADGKMLASYTPSVPWNNTQTQLTVSFTVAAERAYFGGKLVAQLGYGGLVAAVQDRLGSVGKYYPYGEDRSGQTGSDTVRFATYTRDSATGNDYADQRYYSSTLGRFMTPDPYKATAGGTYSQDPRSWNRYSYVTGDPVNFNDPYGRFQCSPDNPACTLPCDPEDPACQGGDPSPRVPNLPYPVSVECSITIEYRPLNIPVFGLLFNHSYIYITQEVDWSDGTSTFNDVLIEGLPQSNIPPYWGNLVNFVDVGFSRFGDSRDPQDHPFDPTVDGPQPGADGHLPSLIGGANVCNLASSIENTASTFSSITTKYDPTNGNFIPGGHNSNWFAWLVTSINGVYLGTPPNAPGFP